MEIKLKRHDRYIDKRVEEAARQAGCEALVRWWLPDKCRFRLAASGSIGQTPATFQQHDDTIARLFIQYPDATVRTAKAIYDGAADFEAQRKARV